MLRKFSAVGVSSVLKCCFVLGVPLFKCSFCQSYIGHMLNGKTNDKKLLNKTNY